MTGFLILLGLSGLLLILLVAESFAYNRRLWRIPMRITVSGTRGKTSIVRALSSVLREHGIRVLAKTTGSEAMYILPDGSMEKVPRRGLITILEQKRLVAKAVKLGAGCLVAEIMSIHPDNHKVETHKLLKPGLTVMSNFRADHTDVTGSSLREISELFVNDIFPGSKIVIPESEINEFILKGILQNKAEMIAAVPGISRGLNLPAPAFTRHIPANLDTVVTTARSLGIPDDTVVKGICNTLLDIGQLKIFRFDHGTRKAWFVNAFAANDPVSTMQVMDQVREMLAPEFNSEPEIAGLISLRSDRGERSRQWLDFLASEGKTRFNRTYVSGIHSSVFVRKLNNCKRLTTHSPEGITRHIAESAKGDVLVFGIANIHGLGRELIDYWNSSGNL